MVQTPVPSRRRGSQTTETTKTNQTVTVRVSISAHDTITIPSRHRQTGTGEWRSNFQTQKSRAIKMLDGKKCDSGIPTTPTPSPPANPGNSTTRTKIDCVILATPICRHQLGVQRLGTNPASGVRNNFLFLEFEKLKL